MSTLLSKSDIRLAMRKQRAAFIRDGMAAASRRIAERVMALPEFRRAETLCLYQAFAGEVETKTVAAAAWKAGKRVAIPARRQDGEYMPAWYTPDEPMTRGHFSVMEPVTPHWAKPDRFDLLMIPGLAFSATGARLGHGRGYYDRMLARLGKRVGTKVGVCFAAQLVPEIPISESDVGMDLVVTEDAVTRAT